MEEDNVVELPTADAQYKTLRDGLLARVPAADEDDLTALKAQIKVLTLDVADR
jgi:hypothetical protein